MPDRKLAETMGQAAALMGVPVAILKAAKRQGAPGFVGSRVDMPKLSEWLKANPLQEDSAMGPMERQKFRKLKADADAKEFALQVKRGDYLHKDEVKSAVMRSVAAARSALRGKASGLSITLASMTGADPVALEERIQESNRDVISELHRAPFGNSVVRCEKCGHEQKL